MPYVEGDRSDCQPSTTTIALSLGLRAIELALGCQSDLSPSTQGMIFMLMKSGGANLNDFFDITFIWFLCIYNFLAWCKFPDTL